MKNNFKKILSGLMLVTMVTGCNTTNSSSTSLNNNSTNSNSSSVIDSSKVTEAQWKAALSLDSFANVTIDAEMEMSYGLGVSYAAQSMVMESVASLTENVYYSELGMSAVIAIDKVKLQAEQEVSDEEFEIMMQMMATQQGGELVVEGDIYKIVLTQDSQKQYMEKDTDVTFYSYGYDSEEDKYLKTKQLGSFSDLFLEGFGEFYFADSFNDAEYDETTKSYVLDTADLLKITGSTEEDFGTATLIYTFENEKLLRLEASSSYESEEGKETTKYIYEYSNYGTTTVTLPTNVYTCEHNCETYDDYNDGFHYTYCDNCESVIEYEAHAFGDDFICSECGYFPERYEDLVIDGLDEAFEITVAYNELNDEIVGLYFYYDSSEYDENDNNILYYYVEGSESYIKETYSCELIDDTKCLYQVTYTYEFYGSEGGEALRDPISYTYTYEDHYFNDEVLEKDENCIANVVSTCEDCGHVEEHTEVVHNDHLELENPVEDEISFPNVDATCPDCGTSEDGTEYCLYWSDENVHKLGVLFGHKWYYSEYEHVYEDNICIYCGYEKVENIESTSHQH